MGSTIRLSTAEQLLAAVPALLGFTPEHSLVLTAIDTRDGTRGKIGITLRADLPDTEHDYPDLTAQLVQALRNNDARAVLAVVIDAASTREGLPRRDLIEFLTHAFAGRGIELTEALWAPRLAAEEPYSCYFDIEHCGLQKDPGASTVAAAAVQHGLPVLNSRRQLAAELAPNDAVDQHRRADLVTAEVLRTPLDDPAARQRRYELLHAALRAAANDVLPHAESGVIALLAALSDPAVRDTGIGDTGQAAQRLWTILTREAPTPARAEPAALLAVAAYRAGDGARASVALDIALAACPDHTLALLVSAALQRGLAPQRCEPAFIHAVEQATALCQATDPTNPDASR